MKKFVIFFAVIAMACAGNNVEGEKCGDGVDNDGDGLIDCQDPDCFYSCPSVENCSDGEDNDHDSLVDCEDPDCFDYANCQNPEICNDAADNDGDGLIDCADPDCGTYAGCNQTNENCNDLTDNDGDGLIDCADSDCQGTVFCSGSENCADGVDNDGDGQVDCADSDCSSTAICSGSENCADGVDNDSDGLIDCADPDCDAFTACQSTEICDDNIDNDGDGQKDCRDPDCAGSPLCPEICNDSFDNDQDGLVDCADPDCDTWWACQIPQTEVNCYDGNDDDLDGFTDCADTDCSSESGCVRCYDIFTDVPSAHWAHDYIRALYTNQMINGCSSSPLMYCPADPMLRKWFAVALIGVMGETTSSAGLNAYFSDTTDTFSTPYINRLKELGITNGCGTGIFCPDDATLRRDAVVFVLRAMGESESSVPVNQYFSDISGYSAGWINRAFELGIVSGCTATTFCPDSDLNRDAAAAILARAYNVTSDFCGF
ncbi:S-layer homology domain-containing protein [Myxococcota bacterium]|nr:S-layer homology domain-containing protein [Myxococcota bacterium]MBU1382859.1 S-layer homology domain-containing protein [Myxococcota bacterium]MBU1496769.1 S-layer homology domain-containing protein [Myxococcota bacterium]